MANTITFTIPYPATKKEHTAWNKRFGMNAIYSGKHWKKRQEDAEYWHRLVVSELNRQRIKRRLFEKPVRVEFFWDDNLDVDNHAYMGKLILDALKNRLITDDSKKYVRSVKHEVYNGGCIKVVLVED